MTEDTSQRGSCEAERPRAVSFDWESAHPGCEVVQLRLDLEDTHARLQLSRQVLHSAVVSGCVACTRCGDSAEACNVPALFPHHLAQLRPTSCTRLMSPCLLLQSSHASTYGSSAAWRECTSLHAMSVCRAEGEGGMFLCGGVHTKDGCYGRDGAGRCISRVRRERRLLSPHTPPSFQVGATDDGVGRHPWRLRCSA